MSLNKLKKFFHIKGIKGFYFFFISESLLFFLQSDISTVCKHVRHNNKDKTNRCICTVLFFSHELLTCVGQDQDTECGLTHLQELIEQAEGVCVSQVVVTQPIPKFAYVTWFDASLVVTTGLPVAVATLSLQLLCSFYF